MPRPRRSPEARTGSRILLYSVPAPPPPDVEVEGDCWLWTRGGNGRYGQVSFDSRWVYVHRAAYEIFVGPIPEGLTIDHLCTATMCCNPKHLEPVTHRENLLRSPRTIISIEVATTRCPQGHPYDEQNTIRRRRGRKIWRECRECVNARARRRRAEKAAA